MKNKDMQLSQEIFLSNQESLPNCFLKLDFWLATTFYYGAICWAFIWNSFLDMVLPYIFKYGTQEQVDQYIKPMINGETIGAIGTFFMYSNLEPPINLPVFSVYPDLPFIFLDMLNLYTYVCMFVY